MWGFCAAPETQGGLSGLRGAVPGAAPGLQSLLVVGGEAEATLPRGGLGLTVTPSSHRGESILGRWHLCRGRRALRAPGLTVHPPCCERVPAPPPASPLRPRGASEIQGECEANGVAGSRGAPRAQA